MTGEIKPAAGATFLSATMDLTIVGGTADQLTGTVTGASTSNRSITIDTPGFQGSYSSQTGYRLSDSSSTVTFGPAQLVAGTTAGPASPVLLASTSGDIADYLALYRPDVAFSGPAATGPISPILSGAAGWQHTVKGPTSRRTRLNYFAYGIATPVGEMPRSGVVKFTLLGSSNYASDEQLYFCTQGDTLTVDFGTGTIQGPLVALGQGLLSSSWGGVYFSTISGSINGNSVSAPLPSPGGVGQFRLIFTGPNAEELILAYVGDNGRGMIVGAAAGLRNPS
ncbi:MAG TPA: hypothetical protein VF637_09525 [Sphingomicrobium sp.]